MLIGSQAALKDAYAQADGATKAHDGGMGGRGSHGVEQGEVAKMGVCVMDRVVVGVA